MNDSLIWVIDLVDLVTKSWANFQSRDHTVYSVFPFGPLAEEVMMHGRSNNVSKEGEPSTFTWAARMHFRRSEDGKVLIDKYTIIVVSYKKLKRNCRQSFCYYRAPAKLM